MQLLQIVGLGLISTIIVLVLREQQPFFAFLITVVTGLIIFSMLLGKIEAIINTFERLANHTAIPAVYMVTILKMLGVSYIAEFGAQLVRDAGQESIATKIEFAGKIFILVMAIPIIGAITETVIGLLPTGSE